MRSIHRPINMWKLGTLRASLYDTSSTDGSYILRITGYGELKLSYGAETPWSGYSDKITELQLSDRITYTDISALAGLHSLQSIKLISDLRDTISGLIAPSRRDQIYFSDGRALFSIRVNGVDAALLLFAGGVQGAYSIPAAIRYSEHRYPVTQIADNAFRSARLSAIRASGELRRIGVSSFRDCKELVSVSLGASLSSLGDNAFEGCTSIATLSLPCRLETIPKYAFKACTSLSSLTLPKGLKVIKKNAFSGCTSLVRIELPKKLKLIESDAFTDCNRLLEIQNSSAVQLTAGDSGNGEIARNALNIYRDASESNGLTVDSDGYVFLLSDGAPLLAGYIGTRTELCLPKHAPMGSDQTAAYRIAPRAFAERSDITSVTVSEGVSAIGEGAFSACTELKSVTVMNGTKRIASHAFSNCTSLEALYLGSAMKSLDTSAFEGCTALSRIEVAPDNPKLASDGSALFEAGASTGSGCSLVFLADAAVTDYSIPDKVRFSYISQRVTKLSSYSVSSGSKLSSLTISRNITNICSYAICAPLKKLTFNGNAKKWKAIHKGGNWLSGGGAGSAPSIEYVE